MSDVDTDKPTMKIYTSKDEMYLDAIQEHKQRIGVLTLALKAREAELAVATDGLNAVQSLIDNSASVVGLHRNGDFAPWDELLAGGQFEDWLRPFSEARSAPRIAAMSALIEAAREVERTWNPGVEAWNRDLSDEAFAAVQELTEAVRACNLGGTR